VTGAGTRGPDHFTIGVFASMKQGLEHFIYREVSQLSRLGAHIELFPTKSRSGHYQPDPSWGFHGWNVLGLAVAQVLALVRDPTRYARLTAHAIRYRALPELALAWLFASGARTCDVLYATFGDRKLFVAYYCHRITGRPLATEIHAYELYANPNVQLFRLALSTCAVVITVTEHNRQLLTSEFDVEHGKVEVVRLSVDLDDYRPRPTFRILIVASFAARKGHEVLLRAVRRLQRPDLEVWVVGDRGTEVRTVDVRALAEELGVSGKVAFFGKLSGNALKAVFQACDVFCLPSLPDADGVYEGFPAAIAEAMAFGKPVIATRHVEIPAVLDAVLVPEGDDAALARAIEDVLSSPELRLLEGEKNRKLAERYFDSGNASRTFDVLRRAGARGRSAAGDAGGASRGPVTTRRSGEQE
jgi:colanic acid/amylovoran biosynthesis glycosyltransferase